MQEPCMMPNSSRTERKEIIFLLLIKKFPCNKRVSLYTHLVKNAKAEATIR